MNEILEKAIIRKIGKQKSFCSYDFVQKCTGGKKRIIILRRKVMKHCSMIVEKNVNKGKKTVKISNEKENLKEDNRDVNVRRVDKDKITINQDKKNMKDNMNQNTPVMMEIRPASEQKQRKVNKKHSVKKIQTKQQLWNTHILNPNNIQKSKKDTIYQYQIKKITQTNKPKHRSKHFDLKNRKQKIYNKISKIGKQFCPKQFPQFFYKSYFFDQQKYKNQIILQKYQKENKDLYAQSELLLIKITQSKYWKLKINIGEQEDLISDIDLNCPGGFEYFLKTMSNYSTQLQKNIFYCLIKYRKQLVAQKQQDDEDEDNFHKSDGYCRFFIVNMPIKHYERSYVQQVISQFLIENVKKVEINKNKRYGKDFMQRLHKQYYVIDSRCCISVLNRQNIFEPIVEHQNSQSKMYRGLERYQKNQNSPNLSSFIQITKKLTKMSLKSTNSLFSKTKQ